MTVQVKTFRVPNLDRANGDYSVEDMEEEIENHIKNKLNAGFTLASVTSGDAFIVLIFTKA